MVQAWRAEKMLSVAGLSRHFGGLKVLEGVSLEVACQGITGLIGPNGAGKTTLFNIVTGLLKPNSGSVFFEGREITGMAAHKLASLGLARTFQNIRVFGEMTVLDNVVTAMHGAIDYGIGTLFLRASYRVSAERLAREQAFALLEKTHLVERAADYAASLAYGAQRRLELARALATGPRLLLLDEPVAGMNSKETAELMQLIRKLSAEGIAILIIEHDMHFIMNLCDRVAVLNFGRLIAHGTAAEIRSNPDVIAAYLGPEQYGVA